MVVPLLGAGDAVQGAMAVWRSGGEPFEARELEFLVGLSRQASVALRNARLFDATRAALERQTASAAILRIISESPTDIQPVFRAIVDSAFHLFRDSGAALIQREGEFFRVMARAQPGRPAGEPSAERVPLDAEANFPSQVILGKRMLHIADWLDGRAAAARAARAGQGGLPLLADAADPARRRVHRRARRGPHGRRARSARTRSR